MIKQAGCILIALAAGVAAGRGQSEQATNPTVITSRTLTFDYKRSVAILEGDVDVADPQMKMKTDKLNVLFDATNSVKAVVAIGNVRLWYQDKTATCRHAVYIARTGEVTMTGNATLKREKDTVSGDEIVFRLNDDRMTCSPGHLVIYPQEGDRAKAVPWRKN
jgi:lipopolysaccharide transport protein LptA